MTPTEAEAVLSEIASVFLNEGAPSSAADGGEKVLPKLESMYRVLVEQIPAVVFIAYLDGGMSEAYVSPQIETTLGFSQEEWLGDPVRWYRHIHIDDKERWSVEAAKMFLTGEPLRSTYRVITRSGDVVWFRCEAKMVRRENGRPWFIHGIGFDVTDLKQTEKVLKERTHTLRNLSTQLLHLQDQERRHIARELHDSIGQYLAALKMNFDLLRAQSTNHSEMWTDSLELLERSIGELRTLSHLLHPPLIEEAGLVSAVRWFVEGFAKRSGIHVSLEIVPEIGRLTGGVELALFRSLQEALTNVHRHSGSENAEIRLAVEGDRVTLNVKDSGCGIPADLLERFEESGVGAGVGLTGMRERVEVLGGQLKLKSEGSGTLVTVSMPIEEPTDDASSTL